ncbi:MAG: DUF1385 domain-containing protein [Tissierellia bacterium]|nr:DUF1385 domain-containing protein [Tissierellia bacterium]
MRGPKATSIVVRKPNGEMELTMDDTVPISSKSKWFRMPLIRGVIGLVDSLRLGTNALMYSASFYEEEEESEEKGWFDKLFGDKADKIFEGLALVFSFALAMLLFFFIPTIVTSLFKTWIDNTIALNLVEGIFRIAIFLIYIVLVSRLEDMRRVFMYHGAEHKTIYCYEKGLELTVENVRKQSRMHPRCGTSFLFSVMLISIVVLSFFGWPNPLVRVLTRLALLPVIMGIAYEVNRILGRSSGPVARVMTYPGLFIQKIATVMEPDDDQIEVAIMALKAVIPEDPELDKW